MSLTGDEYLISDWVGFSFGLLSLLFSILTLYVIYRMCKNSPQNRESNCDDETEIKFADTSNKSPSVVESSKSKFSGYFLLIVSMALCQILYDFSYMLRVVKQYPNCLVSYFLTWLGGLSVAIWSNILSFIIYYVVTYIRSVVRCLLYMSFSKVIHNFVTDMILLSGNISQLSFISLPCCWSPVYLCAGASQHARKFC